MPEEYVKTIDLCALLGMLNGSISAYLEDYGDSDKLAKNMLQAIEAFEEVKCKKDYNLKEDDYYSNAGDIMSRSSIFKVNEENKAQQIDMEKFIMEHSENL